MDASSMVDADVRRALQADFAPFNCAVQQADGPSPFTDEPRTDAQCIHWRWRDLEPLLDRLGREVTLAADGPRRTLRLVNPGLAKGTTPLFSASIQVIFPGEVATAHRHSANAFRFIMHGSGATTTVDGECYPMSEGDLVLTPANAWHDHVHRGDAPMIWLDVLDIPLMQFLQSGFFEDYPADIQPVNDVPDLTSRQHGSGLMAPTGARSGRANPLLTYTGTMARAALAALEPLPPDPFDDAILDYHSPADGGPVMASMGMRLQSIRAGFRGRAQRHTGSKLYHVVRGRGRTRAGDRTFDWSAGDFFTVGSWCWHDHANVGDDTALLFQVNDLPTVKALGYYRAERPE